MGTRSYSSGWGWWEWGRGRVVIGNFLWNLPLRTLLSLLVFIILLPFQKQKISKAELKTELQVLLFPTSAFLKSVDPAQFWCHAEYLLQEAGQ